MKKLILTVLCFGFYMISSAQTEPQIGDEFKITEPYAQIFNHVKFPKTNILHKKGVVSGYQSVYGDTVVVEKVITKSKGNSVVILKKKDGSKFFGFLSTVKAYYQNAIDAGELTAL